jgi:hypothetical protein
VTDELWDSIASRWPGHLKQGVDLDRGHHRAVDWRRVAGRALLAAVVLYLVASAVRIYERKYYIFLPDYLHWTVTAGVVPHSGPTHVFFLFVDHFEPDWSVGRTRRWLERYSSLASHHHDATGRPLQHTWFYPGEQVDPAILAALRDATVRGLGEVELHYHHGYDTAATLLPQLRQAIADFQQFGFLKTIDGRTHFAFIHGNSGLDNACGPESCGVNDELRLLRDLGCFADFTFPSVYLDSQPPSVNVIYAAKDDPLPRSYAKRLPLGALKDGRADLMIFQGPLVFAPSLSVRRLFLDLDDGNVHPSMPASARRVDSWVRANIHIPERPDWVFIKIFNHGVSSAEDENELFGEHFDEALTHLERRYNDGHEYILHYITAREAYNLAMAASDGNPGDPVQYFDRTIPPYLASGRQLTATGP